MSYLYKSTAVTGTKYRRCARVIIHNQLQHIPSITFEEEEVMVTGGKIARFPIHESALFKAFSENTPIPLRNSDTNEFVLDSSGSQVYFTHKDLYEMLYSIYMVEALARDSATESQQV